VDAFLWLFARDEPLRGPRQHSGWAVNDYRVGPILDRKLNVGFADRNPVHLAAMGALNFQCLLPGSGQAVWVGLDTGRGSTMGSGACEEQRRHNTLQTASEAMAKAWNCIGVIMRGTSRSLKATAHQLRIRGAVA
jgi:hypothetical protein